MAYAAYADVPVAYGIQGQNRSGVHAVWLTDHVTGTADFLPLMFFARVSRESYAA